MSRSYAPQAGITILVFLITSIPYLVGYLVQSSAMRFTGIVFDVVDTAQYYSWMRAFSHQAVIANPLTPEAGADRFFNLQWWLLGLLAFKTPVGFTIAYQLLRVLGLAGFAVALAWFCRLAIPRHQLLAFAVVMVGAGLGWTLVVLKQFTGDLLYPLDVQIAEPNTFFSAMAFPHLLVAAALLLVNYALYLTANRNNRWSRMALLTGITLVLGFSHGYDLIPAMVVPGLVTLVLIVQHRRLPEQIWPTAAIVAGAALPALYALALTRLDATWKGVLEQYDNASVFTPSPPHLLILLGLPFLLAIPQLRPGAWRSQQAQSLDPALFVRVWFVAGFFLLYIPTDYQVKMLIAYQVPAAILAVQTLADLGVLDRGWFTDRLPGAGRLAVPAALVAVVILTNIYLTAWRVVDLRREDYPYFLASSDVVVLQQLDGIVEPGDVVLSSPEIGVFVPVYSDARPYVAHWAQTLRYFERQSNAEIYFDEQTPPHLRDQLLTENGIDFVVAGPSEAALNEIQLLPDLALEPVISGNTTLYRTNVQAQAGDE